jgi:SET domain-containing protein
MLTFESFSLKQKIEKKCRSFEKKGIIPAHQLWYGTFYADEIKKGDAFGLVKRAVDPLIGDGVFATRRFRPGDWIGLYSGLVRKRRWFEKLNPYCFEFTLISGEPTPWTIDALSEGGIVRFINHGSDQANCKTALATLESMSYVILIAKTEIEPGDQLLYDYGKDYWAARSTPLYITARIP